VRRLGADGHDVSAATFTEAFRVWARFDVDRADARPCLYECAGDVTPVSGIRSRAQLLSTPEDARDG
jgi:hypothetical protein